MTSRRVAASVGIVAITAVVATTVGMTTASAHSDPHLDFTNKIDSLTPVDLGAPGPSVGDQFLVASHVVSGDVQGTVAASCQLISSIGAGVRMCEVDFSLTHGTITTRGLTDAKNTKVRLVITGGTGRYAGAWGQGTLTPTATGSVVGIRPHR